MSKSLGSYQKFAKPACFLVLITGLTLATFAFAQDAEPRRTLITNVNIFDGVNDGLMPGSVLIEDNLIAEIGGNISAPRGTTIIDGGGRTLMPGLIDSHVHFNVVIEGGLPAIEASRWDRIAAVSAHAAREWLLDGFTTVRDMGGLGDGLKQTIDEGLLIGPRIYPSGSYISQTSGHGDLLLGSQRDPQLSNLVRLGVAQLADGADAVRAAARKNFAEGATQLKLMIGGGISSIKGPLFAPQYTDAEISAAVYGASARQSYVAVHVYQNDHVRRALELGVMSIEHGQFIDEETALLLKEKGAFISPFMASVVGDGLFSHPVYGAVGSPQYLKSKEMQESSSNFVDVIKKVKPNIVFAIDVVNETGINARKHRDHEKFVFADQFGNFEALKAMTSTPGELAQLTGGSNPYPNRLGVIEVGAYADILLVDGNPLEDIGVLGGNPLWFDAEPREEGLETINLIMKNGTIYKNTIE